MTSASSDVWQRHEHVGSPGLKEYIRHSFLPENGVGGVKIREIESKLYAMVREAMKAGIVDDIDWTTFPLPQTFLLEQLHRKVRTLLSLKVEMYANS